MAAFVSPVYAANLSPQLQVEGNKKTRIGFIQFLVQDCLKDLEVEDWPGLRSMELQQCIHDTKLFSEVKVEIAEPVIHISVVERWTIIPIPFVQAGQNSDSVGLFLVDTHFLGLGKKAAVGGTVGDRGNSFFLSYRDPAINFSDWTASIRYINRQLDYLRYEKDRVIDAYTEAGDSGSLGIGYKFMPSLEAGAQLQLYNNHYEALEPYTFVPGDYRYSKLGFFIDYNQTDFHFYFQEGYKLRAQVATQISRNDNAQNVTDFEFNYDWQSAILNEHVLQVKLASRVVDSEDVRDSYKPGGNLGYRGVEPASIWARESHSLSFDYKIPVFNSRQGVWTIGPFVDHAVFKEYDTASKRSSTSYGGAVYLFLKGLALPGIGIMIGRNKDYLGNFASLSIGFGLN